MSLTGLVTERDRHFRELLKTFPSGMSTLANTLYDGRFHVNMWMVPGTVCDYGNEAGQPKSTDRTPLDTNAACSPSFSGQQRGSAHTPPAAK